MNKMKQEDETGGSVKQEVKRLVCSCSRLDPNTRSGRNISDVSGDEAVRCFPSLLTSPTASCGGLDSLAEGREDEGAR